MPSGLDPPTGDPVASESAASTSCAPRIWHERFVHM